MPFFIMQPGNTQPVNATDFLQSAVFTTLFEAAQNFCIYIENEIQTDKDEFVQKARKLVAALYTAALQIPKLVYDSLDSDCDYAISKEAEAKITTSIYSRIPFQYYWITLEPFQTIGEIETGMGDVADDLLDIYKDLKASLLAYNSAGKHTRERALWLLELGFTHHWGQHCIDALQAIHHYLHDPK